MPDLRPDWRALPCLAVLLLAASAGRAQQASVPVPEMVQIPAGSFQMGSEEGASWEKPVHQVEVSAFRIARRPVSVREFRAFRPQHALPGGETEVMAQMAERPVTGVTWDDAVAYAQWLTQQTNTPFRLPTEAEWERAARGGLEQQKYPWGDEPAPVPEDRIGDPEYRPEPRPNPFGVIAAHENLWEWTADWYDPVYYQSSPPKDPRGAASGQFRVLRGGGYRNDPNSVRTWNRGSARPSSSSNVIGFRVAHDEIPEAPPPAVTRVEPPSPAPVPQAAPTPEGPPPAIAPPAAQPAPSSPASPPSGLLAATGIETTQDGGGATILVATSDSVTYNTMRLSGPDRLVVDIEGAAMQIPAPQRTVPINHLGIVRVRSAQFSADPPVVRIVVDMERRLDFNIEDRPDGFAIRLQATP